MELHERLENCGEKVREEFQQTAANTRYFHTLLVEELERLSRNGVRMLISGKNHNVILDELCDLEQQAQEVDYQNTCWNLFRETGVRWDYATSRLFIVVPSDLESWDDFDPSTHRFHLFFICDTWKSSDSQEEAPQHVHLSNHFGYNLNRPLDFFQVYGEYVLKILQMIKCGYSDDHYEVPPLDTLEILWDCTPDLTGSHITEANIESLVDKAIDYLHNLSPDSYHKVLGLNHSQSTTIKSYLDVHAGDNLEGSLHRFIDSDQDVHWICQAHIPEHFNSGSLKALIDFVHNRNGHIDLRKAKLSVDLESEADADWFRTILRGTRSVFDVAIRLNWSTSRRHAEEFCGDIAKMGTVVLEIDGFTTDVHSQDLVQYTTPSFIRQIMSNNTIKNFTLLNYPRLQEQCIYIDMYGLQLGFLPNRSEYDWVQLRSDLIRFGNVVSKTMVLLECQAASKEFQATLSKLGLPEASVVTIYHDHWTAVFDLQSGAFTEVQSQDVECPEIVRSARSLCRLTEDLLDATSDKELYRILQIHSSLQELNISTYGRDVLQHVEHIARLWSNSPNPLLLTLLDRMDDSQGRTVAQLVIRRRESNCTGSGTVQGLITRPTHPYQKEAEVSVDIEFLQWSCDHTFFQLSNFSATYLEMATYHYPSILNFLTLDVSRLSRVGLAHIRDVLCRSYLQHLRVICLDSHLSRLVSEVLDSVPWSTLQSLALSGTHLDEWLRHWPSCSIIAPRLRYLVFRGIGPKVQELSHSSTLFVHQLIYTSPLEDFQFLDVTLQQKLDWRLIVGAVDFELLRFIDLCPKSTNQLISDMEAMDLFISTLQTARHGANITTLTLKLLTLDIKTLPSYALGCIRKLLSLVTLEHFRIMCTSLDSYQSNPLAQVCDSVQWSTLKSLELFGDNINEWIQILAKVNTPRLEYLYIRGTQSVHQELSHASVLFVQQKINASPLVLFNIQDVRLEDQREWALIVKNMDLSVLPRFSLGGSSYDQFQSARDAVGPYDFKPRQRDGDIKGSVGVEPELGGYLKQWARSDIKPRPKREGYSDNEDLDSGVEVNEEDVSVTFPPFYSSKSSRVIQVLRSVRWPMISRLNLSGTNIDEWIERADEIYGSSVPELTTLTICGTTLDPQILGHSSVLCLRRMIKKRSLVKLTLKNIQLQNKRDWVILVESMNLALISVEVCDVVKDQLQSRKEAMDLLTPDIGRPLRESIILRPLTSAKVMRGRFIGQ